MICVSLPARSNDEMLHMMHESAPEADVLELRLDGIAEPDLPRLLAARLRPVIVTNRPAQEGGLYHGSESRRLRLLEQACSLGAEYVDIELAAGAFHGKGAKRIVSFHDFKGMPANLSAVRGKLVEAGADIAKMAVTANDVVDNLAVFHLLQAAAAGADRVATIALCMGEAGLISRLLSPKFGGFLTDAAARLEGKERPAAPGQISARRLREEFRYAKISRSTDIFGVIGNPVAHSLSPAIHNAAYDELALDAVYVPFLVRDVQGFVPAFRALGVKGFSVTIPHKEAALATADEVDDIARRIGAANTLYERGGKLRATNTDCAAAVAALETALGAAGERGSALRNKRAVVVGAGGAARAVVFGLGDRGAAVTIVNRTRERGARLAEEANRTRPGSCRSDGLDALPTLDFDILCNLTSVGMYPDVDATPVPRGILKPQHIVFDAVYNPLETRLLREAREAGCTVVPGLDWFIGQAAAQFLLWTGRPAPHETMRRAAMERLKKDEG
jgi:3-dehydroquinate dehydratase/shikimate dehydrogenase